MSLRARQQSKYVGERRWRWSVWVDGPAAELDQVEYVEYTLHPTFPEPVQRTEDRDKKFRLNAIGWGEFMIYVQVGRKDGQVLKLTHWLKLNAQSKLPTEERPDRLTVLISSGIADAPVAAALRDAFSEAGVDVLTPDDINAGQPVRMAFDSLLDSADAAVIVVSDKQSPWLAGEIEAIQSKQIPVTRVLIGSEDWVPEQFSDLPSLRLGDLEGAASVARQISDQLRKDAV